MSLDKKIRMVHCGTNEIDMVGEIRDFDNLLDKGIIKQTKSGLIFNKDFYLAIHHNGNDYCGEINDKGGLIVEKEIHLKLAKLFFAEQLAENNTCPFKNTGKYRIDIDVTSEHGGGGAYNAAYWTQTLYNALGTLPNNSELPSLETVLAVLDADDAIRAGLPHGITYRNLRDGCKVSRNLSIHIHGANKNNRDAILIKSPPNKVDFNEVPIIAGRLDDLTYLDPNNTFILPNNIRNPNYAQAIIDTFKPLQWKERFFLSSNSSMINDLYQNGDLHPNTEAPCSMDYITPLLKASSFVSMNADELDLLYAKMLLSDLSLNDKMDNLSNLMKNGTVCITQGARGASLYANSNYFNHTLANNTTHSPAIGTDEARDAFFGAFTLLYAICKHKNWRTNFKKIMEVATEVAQASTKLPGAVGPPNFQLNLTSLQDVQHLDFWGQYKTIYTQQPAIDNPL